MQRVRADGFGRLDPLDDARPHRTSGTLAEFPPEPFEYPLAMVEWHDAWFDLDQADPTDGEGLRAVTHIPLPIVERIVLLGPSSTTT